MYYLITEYELPVLAVGETRKMITIGNQNGFVDMYDDHPLRDVIAIVTEEALKDFMKDGFITKDDAENAVEIKHKIASFIGMFFDGDFEVVSEDELLQKYNTLSEELQ